jgi:hypothetical protein
LLAVEQIRAEPRINLLSTNGALDKKYQEWARVTEGTVDSWTRLLRISAIDYHYVSYEQLLCRRNTLDEVLFFLLGGDLRNSVGSSTKSVQTHSLQLRPSTCSDRVLNYDTVRPQLSDSCLAACDFLEECSGGS